MHPGRTATGTKVLVLCPSVNFAGKPVDLIPA